MRKSAPQLRATIQPTALLVLLALGGFSAFAQTPKPGPPAGKPAPKAEERKPEPFKNLQVLPKDIGHDELFATMRSWARGTGMRCDDCHVEDAKTHEHDYASDDLEHKKIARQMLKMVLAINKDYIATISSHEGEKRQNVTCYSCHRGQEEPPRDLATMVTAIATEKGTAAALARYQEIKKDHLNDGRYDFSERSLIIVASNLADAKKMDDAIAILRADLEIYPASANLHATLGRFLAENGDLAGAEASLKKALEIDPKNDRAKRALADLYKDRDKAKPQ